MEFLAAAIQYNCIPLKKEENLAVLTRMIRDEANQVAKLIVLPEMCTTGYYFFHRDAAAAMAEEITGGETVGHLVQLCAQHGCYIAAGLMEREGEILYNSAVLIGPEGFIGKHRKLHFFAPDGHWAQEGDLPITAFETPIGKIAMLICMDISFPEAARTARLLGADIICCPVNWFDPVIPSNVWVTRAYENQLFFVVANRLGEEAGFSFSGGSCVIAPNGVILDHVRQKTGIAYGTIRLPQDTESSFPSRRPELYQELSLRRFNWSRNLLARTFSSPPLPDGCILQVAVSPFVPGGGTLWERQAALCDYLREECPVAELAVFPGGRPGRGHDLRGRRQEGMRPVCLFQSLSFVRSQRRSFQNPPCRKLVLHRTLQSCGG